MALKLDKSQIYMELMKIKEWIFLDLWIVDTWWNFYHYNIELRFFLFVFVWVFRSTREFYTHMETSLLPVKGCKFDLRSALMAIEQWGFLSVPHLLINGASVYNSHLRGPVTLTPIAEFLAVELSLLDLRLRSVAAGIRTPNLPHARWTL